MSLAPVLKHSSFDFFAPHPSIRFQSDCASRAAGHHFMQATIGLCSQPGKTRRLVLKLLSMNVSQAREDQLSRVLAHE
tara:strand:+ start:329 stop:562 length:234 start_codon:yes stop_codon:yes gene_type:complete